MESRPTIAPRGRLLLAAIGLAACAALATATTLTPDARGYGTHEQLGWAPCWFRGAMGRPCPSCGMTTSWAHAVRGDARAAVATNAGGAMGCWLAATVAPWLLACAVAGRWLLVRPAPRAVLWMGTVLVIITLLDWARRLISP
jgi:hypothetical protein